jgi:hypothetical protein
MHVILTIKDVRDRPHDVLRKCMTVDLKKHAPLFSCISFCCGQ